MAEQPLSSLSNFDKWQSFMSGFISPQVYVDFGFYYLISASLQRRVWYGPDHSPLYPNQYIVFVGEPGIGKGLVLKQVANILRHHKLKKRERTDVEGVNREVIEMLAAADLTDAEKDEQRGSKEKLDEPLLIPVAADATTYEALVAAMCRALRRKDFPYFDEKLQRKLTGVYTHSSLAFCLEELSSLLRRHADDVVQFLHVGFDCGDYKKDTKTQGTDKIQRMCVNLLAGTTPSFMQRTFSDGLLNEGMSSRSLFLFAPKNRSNKLIIPDLSPEQLVHQQDIIKHVEKLSQLYGRVTTTPETESFLQVWWDEQQRTKVNTNEKLKHYYARKNIHMRKLAMAIHFGESTSMELTLEDHIKAIKALEGIEVVMHHALIHGVANPLYRLGLKITEFIEENDGATGKELLTKFWDELPSASMKQVEDILTHLLIMQKITTTSVQNCKGMITKYIAVKETKLT